MSGLWIQHIAGPMSPEGVQLCTRCGVMMKDYRNSMVLDGDTTALSGWREGDAVWTIGANPQTWMTADPSPEYPWRPCKP